MKFRINKRWSLNRPRFAQRILGLMLMAVSLARADGGAVVSAQTVMATNAAHPDSTVKLAIVAQVQSGYHINDHKPTIDYLIPTQIKLEPSDQFTLKNTVYPKGFAKKFSFSDTPLSVYEGKFVVGTLLYAGKTVAPGVYTLKGKISYQACNDHACLAPTSVPLALSITVVPSNVPLKTVNADVFRRINLQ
jgi:hypothetical protein